MYSIGLSKIETRLYLASHFINSFGDVNYVKSCFNVVFYKLTLGHFSPRVVRDIHSEIVVVVLVLHHRHVEAGRLEEAAVALVKGRGNEVAITSFADLSITLSV